jgi:ABC-type phosphate/phosphonate transport system ATPase subunit
MIELKNVCYTYKNGKEAIKDINLTIKDGEFVAIIGKNGSRKIYFI